MDPQKLIERLQGEGAQSLAALSIDSMLDGELGALLTPAVLVSSARSLLQAWLASDGAVKVLNRGVEALAHELQAERRALKDLAPRDVRQAARELLERPFSPDKKLVLTIIDREPTRNLVRQLLLDAILDFARKASAPMAGMARGLGSLAKFAGDSVKSRTGGLGSLVGAVSGEVERQLEKRAVEFVDAAMGGVFGQIADALSDPRRANEAAELRLAFFDGVLELTGPQLARELINLDIAGGAQTVRAGLTRWLGSEASEAQLQQFAAQVFERAGKRTTRETLAELGLLEVTRSIAIEQLAKQLRGLAGTAAFAAWLGETA